MAKGTQVRHGTATSGIEHASWGAGPRTLVYLGGGPGSHVPSGTLSGTTEQWFAPFVEAGHTVHHLSRRRGQPDGHTVADMADDVAGFVRDELAGRADLVVGVSFGGMVAQLLAARHPDLVGGVVLVAAAAEVSPAAKDIDRALASAVRRGSRAAAGEAFGRYVLPGRRWSPLRRLAGPLVGRAVLSGKAFPFSDIGVEAEAEAAFDARPVLPDITAPVVLLCGDEDPFFLPDVVAETARAIPRCELVTYAGRGHLWVTTSKEVPRDALDRLDRMRRDGRDGRADGGDGLS